VLFRGQLARDEHEVGGLSLASVAPELLQPRVLPGAPRSCTRRGSARPRDRGPRGPCEGCPRAGRRGRGGRRESLGQRAVDVMLVGSTSRRLRVHVVSDALRSSIGAGTLTRFAEALSVEPSPACIDEVRVLEDPPNRVSATPASTAHDPLLVVDGVRRANLVDPATSQDLCPTLTAHCMDDGCLHSHLFSLVQCAPQFLDPRHAKRAASRLTKPPGRPRRSRFLGVRAFSGLREVSKGHEFSDGGENPHFVSEPHQRF
jgi:hypothetical protein